MNFGIKDKIKSIKKAQYNIDLVNSLSKQMAPPAIIERINSIGIGDDITKVTIVGKPLQKVAGWPSGLDGIFVDQLLDLGATVGVTMSITALYVPIPPDKSVELYKKSVLKLETNKQTSKDSNEQRVSEQFINIRSKDMLDESIEIIRGNKRQFHVAFLIVVHAKTESDMRIAQSHIKSVMGAHYIQKEVPDYCMLEVLESSLLTSATCNYIWTEQLTNVAVKVAPLKNPNSRMDDNGLLFGEDTKTGRDIIIDLERLPAKHATILAPTGAGKTFTLLMLLMRACTTLGYRCVYITPKPDVKTDYKKVAEAFEGTASCIDLGPGKQTINPLQIFYDRDTKIYTSNQSQQFMNDHKELILQFFKVRLGDELSANMETLLDKTMTDIYARQGIIGNDISTWKDGKWPIMSDLIDVWKRMRIDEKDKDGTAQALINKTYKFEGTWSFLNRQTDVDLTAQFMIIDFSTVPISLSDSMNILITGILGQRLKTALDQPSIIAIDEGRVFLKNKALGDFIIKLITQGRSSDCSLWLSLLQISDFAGVSDEITTNTFLEILLGSNIKKSSVEAIKYHFKLDDESVRSLIDAGVGQGIIVRDGVSTPITFKPTEYEKAVITGKLSELEEIDTVRIKKSMVDIATENSICFDDWVEGPTDLFKSMGYTQLKSQKMIERGTIKTWVLSEKIRVNMIGNQSIDHYCSVCQLAGVLVDNGFSVEINHHNDADVIAEFKGKKYAFEYEHPGSHTKLELVEKDDRNTTKYDFVFFVCSGENYNHIKDSVGELKTIKRGIDMNNLINNIINGE